jgi:hypothetical protein
MEMQIFSLHPLPSCLHRQLWVNRLPQDGMERSINRHVQPVRTAKCSLISHVLSANHLHVIQLAVALLWDIACCINYAKHRGNAVGNPGPFVVADLVAFLAILVSTICVGLFDIVVLDGYPWAWLELQLQTSVRSSYACLGVGGFIGKVPVFFSLFRPR